MQGGGDAGLGTDTLQDVKARIGVHQSCPPCLKTFTDIEGVKMSTDNVSRVYPLFQTEDSGLISPSTLQINIADCRIYTACRLNLLWHSRLPYIHWSNVLKYAVYNN